MNDFASADAAGRSAHAVAQGLVEGLQGARGHTVGFVYVTSPLAGEMREIVDALQAATGVETWVGTAGHGVCGNGIEHWGQPAAAVLTCRLAKGSYRVLPSIASADEVPGGPGLAPAAGLAIVHGDPRNGSVTEIVEALSREKSAYLVGGLTSANDSFLQVAGTEVVEGGVSGLLLGGRLSVAVGLSQGCSPIGPPHEVTRSEGQIVVSLDRQRAYDVMCEDIGIAEGADPRPWLSNIHAAFPVGGSNEADYVVRNLVGIDPRQGLVAIAENIEAGDRVMFVRRDAESAEKDFARMLEGLQGRLGAPPKAGLYYSCVARGPNLFEAKSHEMRAIREAFGDVPIAGFFGNGEISNDRVYGYTGVLTLFS
ncbi:MAG: FIST N-terminal domain-containing protein [Hyphomicrobiaceae bacterium]